MHACEMTLTYLRGGLSTCSVVWVHVRYFSLKFINFLMQLCKNFFSNFRNYGSYLISLELFTLAQPFFWSLLLLRLSAILSYSIKMTISRVVPSIFSDLTSYIATPFAKPQDSLLAGFIFYFSQVLEICVLHWEYFFLNCTATLISGQGHSPQSE